MSNQNYIQAILTEYAKTPKLRQQERNLKTRGKAFDAVPTISNNDLRSNLEQILPGRMIPKNIGSLSEVVWPFTYELSCELPVDGVSGNTIISGNFFSSDSFQVSREAAFILTSIYRVFRSNDLSGHQAPLQIELIDTQSSRRFNDKPIPLQHIGYQGEPLKLEQPMLIYPNSSLKADFTSWLSNEASIEVPNGDGKHSIILQGLRIRIEDVDKVFKVLFNK